MTHIDSMLELRRIASTIATPRGTPETDLYGDALRSTMDDPQFGPQLVLRGLADAVGRADSINAEAAIAAQTEYPRRQVAAPIAVERTLADEEWRALFMGAVPQDLRRMASLAVDRVTGLGHRIRMKPADFLTQYIADTALIEAVLEPEPDGAFTFMQSHGLPYATFIGPVMVARLTATYAHVPRITIGRRIESYRGDLPRLITSLKSYKPRLVPRQRTGIEQTAANA